jgi:eukaryotic-like serine/threonine-protein kinase
MDPQIWKRAKDLYLAASDLEPAVRGDFLEIECAGDENLRREVEQLLEASLTKSFLAEPFVPNPHVPLEPGSLLGHFRIEAAAGKGGFGLVYRATDTQLHRTVAIKVIPEGFSGDSDRRARFAREAVAASALNHPNIVTVYQTGNENGRDYIAMEFIAGATLSSVLAAKHLPLPGALRYAIEIADAVAAAHEAGIVHRDLKPGNVMINDRDCVKVLDFGLAKTVPIRPGGEERSGMTTVTVEGTVVGTLSYMSPEQAEGKGVDARSDIFSFGSILYEMVTGKRAFSEETEIRVLASILHKEPRPAAELTPGLPERLERILERCLRKNPRDRWQHLADVKVLLEDCLKEMESPAAAARAPRRWFGWWAVGAAALGGALLAAGVQMVRGRATPGGPEGVMRMVTTDSGLSTFPALSKDGKLLAFASDRGKEGNLDIWLQQIGGREPIRLTNDPADDTDPAFSPDGTRIAYRSERGGGGIYVAPALGGTPVLLAQDGRNPRFSPDGHWIAYWTGREGRYTAGASRVFVIEAGGGQPKPVQPEMAAAAYPVWSPRGDQLLVLGRQDGSGPMEETLDWFVLPVEKGTPKKTGVLGQLKKQKLTERRLAWQIRPVPFDWVDEGGSRILFAAPLGDTGNLWEVRLSAGGTLAGAATRVTRGPGLHMHAARASDGRIDLMAFSDEELNFDIWSLPVDPDRGIPKGEMKRITEGRSIEWSPSVSHDGRKLAFLSHGTQGWVLQTRDGATGQDATLISSPLRLVNARISGDGSHIVYSSVDSKLFSIPRAGGAVERLCDRCGALMGVSGDALRVTYEPEEQEDLMLLDAAGRKSVKLALRQRPDAILSGGQFSPDGKWIAFHSIHNENSTAQVWVAPAAGNGPVAPREWIAVTDGSSLERDPCWAPGGSLLYFLSERDGFRCIWARRLDPSSQKPSGEAFAVQHFHTARRSLQRVGFSGYLTGLSVGGDRMVFSLGELTGNIWMEEKEREK